MIPSFSSLLTSWGEEFVARSNRIRQLIGGVHWPTDGAYKETLVREFLRRHLSPQVVVTHGFIRPLDYDHCCSPEIDVLLSDFAALPPFFNEGELTIVSPINVVAYIQCKSELNKTTLTDGIANIVATQHVLSRYRDAGKVWRAVVYSSCSESRTAESIATTLAEVLGDFSAILACIPEGVTDRPTALNADLLPKCFATYDKFLTFLSPGEPGHIRVRVFEMGSLAFACLACDLFSFMASHQAGLGANAVFSAIEAMSTAVPVVRDVCVL